jgi:hypothetical protein
MKATLIASSLLMAIGLCSSAHSDVYTYALMASSTNVGPNVTVNGSISGPTSYTSYTVGGVVNYSLIWSQTISYSRSTGANTYKGYTVTTSAPYVTPDSGTYSGFSSTGTVVWGELVTGTPGDPVTE